MTLADMRLDQEISKIRCSGAFPVLFPFVMRLFHLVFCLLLTGLCLLLTAACLSPLLLFLQKERFVVCRITFGHCFVARKGDAACGNHGKCDRHFIQLADVSWSLDSGSNFRADPPPVGWVEP